MKIELTDNEVKQVGQLRDERGAKYFNYALLLLIPSAALAWYLGNAGSMVGVFLSATPFLALAFLAMKVQVAAGRRFLEEQKQKEDRNVTDKPRDG